MKSRIVLAPPYSGVLFWVLSNHTLNRPIRDRFDEKHPYFNMYGGYFRNVIGANPSLLLDKILSLTLLYDEIFLPPADIHLPDYEGSPGRYTSKELGITMDWQWRLEISQKLDQSEVTDFLLKSPKIASLVNSQSDKGEVVWNSVVLLYMSEKLNATIIASQTEIKLLRLIKSVLSDMLSNSVEKAPSKEQYFLNEAFKVAGLRISIENLGEYRVLKSNSTIKEYASSFRSLIGGLPNNEKMETRYYRSMMDLIEKDEFASKLSAELSISATALGVSSLIPVVGVVTGVAGVIADLSSNSAEKIASKNSYWSLAPEISKVLSKHRIEEKVRQLEQGSG